MKQQLIFIFRTFYDIARLVSTHVQSFNVLRPVIWKCEVLLFKLELHMDDIHFVELYYIIYAVSFYYSPKETYFREKRACMFMSFEIRYVCVYAPEILKWP